MLKVKVINNCSEGGTGKVFGTLKFIFILLPIFGFKLKCDSIGNLNK